MVVVKVVEEELDPEMEQKVTVAMQRLRNFQYDLADDVVMARINKELKSIPAVMQELQWNSSGGCAKCRPAPSN